MPATANQIVVYQPNETVRRGLLASIRKAASEQREYGNANSR